MEASSSGVRPASAQDAAACLAIYRPYVENTAISWEIDVPTVTRWLRASMGCAPPTNGSSSQRDDQIIGFAYGQPLKRLATFQWSAETGIYVDVDHHRAGGGRDALHATAAPAHRARLPAGLRRHHPTQRGQQRLSSILRVPGRRLIPARGMEARPLARRGMDATRSAWRRDRMTSTRSADPPAASGLSWAAKKP